jgi:hypothetical protein
LTGGGSGGRRGGSGVAGGADGARGKVQAGGNGLDGLEEALEERGAAALPAAMDPVFAGLPAVQSWQAATSAISSPNGPVSCALTVTDPAEAAPAVTRVAGPENRLAVIR